MTSFIPSPDQFGIAALAALAIVPILLGSIRVAMQYERAVVFRLGRYRRTSGPGLYLVLPIIEQRTVIDMRVATSTLPSFFRKREKKLLS